jgi:hypothetical protein
MNINTFGDTDLSLDYYKELKNNSDKYSTVFSELNNMYNMINTKELKTVKEMTECNKINNQVLHLHESFSRLGRLRNAKEAFLEKQKKEQTKRTIKLKKSTNIKKTDEVLDQINFLFDSLDNLRTRSDHQQKPADSLLNSHKDFILMKKYEEFKSGVPILKLKREDFMEKATYFSKVRINNLHYYRKKVFPTLRRMKINTLTKFLK